MAVRSRVSAFEGGQLKVTEAGDSGREVVLALPFGRLLVRMVRVPAGQDPVEVSAPILQAVNPFPDDQLTVSCETVREDESGRVVIAAALPESSTDDVAEALDGAKLNVTRIDALELGTLRGIWNQLGVASGEDAPAQRRLVLLEGTDGVCLMALDGDRPSAIRSISGDADLRREVMLSLLEAEDFGGAMDLAEIVCVGTAETSQLPGDVLSAFASVRTVRVEADAALGGIAERAQEPDGLDVLPASWREVLEETRFKAKLTRFLVLAGAVWALAMGVLFGVPLVYGYLTDRQKALSGEHRRQYEEVKAMKAKVDLVKKYSDHRRGALEIMKALSDRLPEGIELSSWNFKRDEGVSVSGEADSAELVYKFKDTMAELPLGDDLVFQSVSLSALTAGRGGKQRFSLDCRYQAEETE